MRILVVEDEHKLGQALREGFNPNSTAWRWRTPAKKGFYLVQTESFDLVILDVMLPGRSGLEILKAMRQHGLKNAGPDADGARRHRRSCPRLGYRR